MKTRWFRVLPLLALLAPLALLPHARACDYCTIKGEPLHRELALAPIVLFGHIRSSQLSPDGVRGTSELQIESVVKDSAGALKGKSSVSIHRYVPANPKVKFLVLGEMLGAQFDPYRSFQFNSDRALKYLKDAPRAAPPATAPDAVAWLRYHFDYLNDAEPELAADAFKVWANSSNKDVSLAAPTLSPERLRTWLLDAKTPPERLGLYAYLLGACGKDAEAELLRKLIQNPDERFAGCIDGLLGGYTQLRPADGWKLAESVLADPARPFTQKHAALRFLRFFHSVDGERYKQPIGQCLGLMVKDQNLFDLAVDQLTQWKRWDHTEAILKGYATAKAPMTKRSIVRYALGCPQPAAATFVAELKKKDPKLVADVEEEIAIFAEPGKP